jgi:hypothetical protein
MIKWRKMRRKKNYENDIDDFNDNSNVNDNKKYDNNYGKNNDNDVNIDNGDDVDAKSGTHLCMVKRSQE